MMTPNELHDMLNRATQAEIASFVASLPRSDAQFIVNWLYKQYFLGVKIPKGGTKMSKLLMLRGKSFDELTELANIGIAFMELARKHEDAVDLPRPKRKRRKRVVADASKGNGAGKTKGKAPAVPKPRSTIPKGSTKIPRADIPPLPGPHSKEE